MTKIYNKKVVPFTVVAILHAAKLTNRRI